MAFLVRQSLSGQAPIYLADDCRLVSDSTRRIPCLGGQHRRMHNRKTGILHSLVFRLAWCHEHSAVIVTELLQPQDLACGTLFQFSCIIPTSPTDCSDDSWRVTFFGKHDHSALWLLVCGAIEKHLLTYLPVNLDIQNCRFALNLGNPCSESWRRKRKGCGREDLQKRKDLSLEWKSEWVMDYQ